MKLLKKKRLIGGEVIINSFKKFNLRMRIESIVKDVKDIDD